MQRSGENQGVRAPLPPFDEESARQKVKIAQDAWNTRAPEKVALAYTEDSKWRNRDEFFYTLLPNRYELVWSDADPTPVHTRAKRPCVIELHRTYDLSPRTAAPMP